VDPFSADVVRAAYDAAASDYEAAFGEDLARLPIDRAMLESASGAVRPPGLALDLGCGPGMVGSFLAAMGHDVVGLDLSTRMMAAGRILGRDLRFTQGDMRHLSFRNGAFALVVAYYSIHHVGHNEVGEVVEEVARILTPRGVFLLATHLGDGDVYVDEFLGHPVGTVAGAMYRREDLLGVLRGAGFVLEREQHRGPMPHEFDSERIYLLATLGQREGDQGPRSQRSR
jgi:SAM-dependent methyltransferase